MFFKQLVPSSVWTCTDSLSLSCLSFSIPKMVVGLQAATVCWLFCFFNDDVEEVISLIPQIEAVQTASPNLPSHFLSKKNYLSHYGQQISKSNCLLFRLSINRNKINNPHFNTSLRKSVLLLPPGFSIVIHMRRKWWPFPLPTVLSGNIKLKIVC